MTTVDKYQTALDSFKKNNLKLAESLLEEIITEKPDINSIYFLAVVKSKLKDYKGAIELYDAVIRNQPEHVEAHFNKALCHQHIGENEEAIFHYKKALELNPGLIDAHNNIAVIYRDSGNMEMAEKHALEVYSHDFGDVGSQMSGLGKLKIDEKSTKEFNDVISFANAGNYQKALELLLKLKEKYGELPAILNALGNIYFHLNEFKKAEDVFRKFVAVDSSNPEAYYGLGVCLQQLKKNDEALNFYLKAVELKPDYVDAINNIGLYYYAKKDFETAAVYFNKALGFNPKHLKAMVNLGSTKTFDDKYEEALEIFEKSEELAKDSGDTKTLGLIKANIGFCFLRMGDLDKAIELFDFAIETDPENVLAHYNKAEALLKKGNFEQGWKEYEWRKKREEFGKRKFSKPLDLNRDLTNKKILVYGEQGLGDTFHFVRYLKFLKEKNAYVILECDKSLHELLSKCEFIDELIEKNPELEKQTFYYDYDVSLLSLPLLFNTNIDNIPKEIPYLCWDEVKAGKWSKYFNTSNLKVGIVWAGSPQHQNDRNRSVKLKAFSELFGLEGVEFFSLQKGPAVSQIKEFQDKVKNLDEIGIENFADTAAIMKHLDLIISVDTSVVHLAGALGKEVWVLIPFNSDWRWLTGRNDSPWYPTMTLYRQVKPKQWDDVFRQVKKALEEKLNYKKKELPATERKETTVALNLNIDYSETADISNIVNKIFDEEISNLISRIPQPLILNVGCNAVELLSKKGFEVTGITNNKEVFTKLKEKGFNVFFTTQENTDFPDGKFDFVFSYRTLEKSIYPFLTLKEFKRILKRGGYLYVRTRAFDENEEIQSSEFSLLPMKQWKALFNRAGFSVIHSESTENRNGRTLKDFTFILKRGDFGISETEKEETKKINLALTHGENFGWGVCSNYLKKELSKKIEVVDLDTPTPPNVERKIEGKVFHALKNGSFEPLHNIWGTENYGYTFFENELNDIEVENSKKYDKIFAGSSWCEQKMKEKGIENTGLLIQGIDPDLFYPTEKEKKNDLFVIFSGGKFELRKGQDLVLRAVKILQEKYDDIILINAWYNMWPATMQNMVLSKHIKFELSGNTWEEIMEKIYSLNGLDSSRIFTMPLVPNTQLRELYGNTDLGLFPNRCEGGTNLVLMEYMACAKPVVASFNSGHKDILSEKNSLPLKEMSEFKIYDENDTLISDWQEPSLDEIIAKVEWAYFHREEIKKIGKQAGKDMTGFTWEKSAESLISQIWDG